jgi:hypothetical protein
VLALEARRRGEAARTLQAITGVDIDRRHSSLQPCAVPRWTRTQPVGTDNGPRRSAMGVECPGTTRTRPSVSKLPVWVRQAAPPRGHPISFDPADPTPSVSAKHLRTGAHTRCPSPTPSRARSEHPCPQDDGRMSAALCQATWALGIAAQVGPTWRGACVRCSLQFDICAVWRYNGGY